MAVAQGHTMLTAQPTLAEIKLHNLLVLRSQLTDKQVMLRQNLVWMDLRIEDARRDVSVQTKERT